MACERGLKLPAITAANREHGSVVEENLVFAIGVELEAANTCKIHDKRSVNTTKGTRIEVLFQLGHTAPQ